MRYADILFSLLWAIGACAESGSSTVEKSQAGRRHPAPVAKAVEPLVARGGFEPRDDPCGLFSTATSKDTPASTSKTPTTTATTATAVTTATTSKDAPTATPSSMGAITGACSQEGQWNCIGGTSYQQCASGMWSVVTSMAPGTKCTPGKGTDLGIVAARDIVQLTHGHRNRRDTYPINCHLHSWPSASVASIKQAYSLFYQLWAPLEADAQHCRRIACFGNSGVWLCADSLDYKNINSVVIADKMNELLDGDNGCLDRGNKNMVQGQVFTSEGWCVLVRGGEDCSVDPPEQPIFY
ncbi:hypothetical protein ANO14919_048120 [Xylariales sp. No.14919]|nr:hypothetical protein ANO14919_048120 [Xylariales sp. No.14919]